ncbi:MAG TPA: AbrB/MazE/SpoVT family DNA-binding domain-containing protein [Chloroflexota bacterium]|nr:AbrB/MazE/SpoVT family DNA-binding domain-containing protein [Chloroflexota bacterium]
MSVIQQAMVRVQTRGRITVPSDVRKKLNLRHGDVVTLVQTPRGVLLTSSPLPFLEVLGFLTPASSDLGAIGRDPGEAVPADSRGILNMRKLGDALRARLREPVAAGR